LEEEEEWEAMIYSSVSGEEEVSKNKAVDGLKRFLNQETGTRSGTDCIFH
jgi:hypothetical protein